MISTIGVLATSQGNNEVIPYKRGAYNLIKCLEGMEIHGVTRKGCGHFGEHTFDKIKREIRDDLEAIAHKALKIGVNLTKNRTFARVTA